jgi:hypothetical protein
MLITRLTARGDRSRRVATLPFSTHLLIQEYKGGPAGNRTQITGLEDPYMPYRVSSGHVVECRRRDSLPPIVSMECR